jgi:hypothetical protein
MPHFDPDKPHAQVYGTPGVYWQQFGNYFRLDGAHVPGDPDRDRELKEIEASIGDPKIEPEVRASMRKRLESIKASLAEEAAPVEVAAVTDSIPSDDMRRAENKALKAQMEIYGEIWQGVAHARKFLEGRG